MKLGLSFYSLILEKELRFREEKESSFLPEGHPGCQQWRWQKLRVPMLF